MRRRFTQVDVFGARPYQGNPVAVVLDASGLDSAEMALIAQWTNLSETTFVLPPTRGDADYRVRIFTPAGELPFAGHPTLGTAHAWMMGQGLDGTSLVQECQAGLIPLRQRGGRLFFAAPPLVRYEPADEDTTVHLARLLGVGRSSIRGAQWVDNGPGWVAVLLDSAAQVLHLHPQVEDGLKLGVAGPYPEGGDAAYEVRAFYANGGVSFEDPVTGSLNASLARWLFDAGLVDGPYVVRQGTAIGRDGRIHIDREPDGTIWVGGSTFTAVEGTLEA